MKKILLFIAIFACLLESGCSHSGNGQDSFYIQVEFSSIEANGSSTESTDTLILCFDMDIAGFNASDITLIPGSTGASRGSLNKTSNEGEYELLVNGINMSGGITVMVNKSGYSFSPESREVYVYYYKEPDFGQVIVSFDQITDMAPIIEGPVIHLSGANGPEKATITLENPGQYSSIEWFINGITGQGASFTLDSSNSAYNSIGKKMLNLEVIKDGKPYSQNIEFTVAE